MSAGRCLMSGIDTVAEGGIGFPVVGIDATPVILITNRAVDVQSIDVFEFTMFYGEILISHFRAPLLTMVLKMGCVMCNEIGRDLDRRCGRHYLGILRDLDSSDGRTDLAQNGAHLLSGDWKSGSERAHIYENRSFLISFGKRSLPKKTFSHYNMPATVYHNETTSLR